MNMNKPARILPILLAAFIGSEGLALAQLAPGPLAAQLSIYLGYVHYRIAGATLAGIAFVLPSFLMVLALGWAYVQYGGLSWMQAVFYGVGASVIGIIAFLFIAKRVLRLAVRLLLVAVFIVALLAAGAWVWWNGWFADPTAPRPPHPAATPRRPAR